MRHLRGELSPCLCECESVKRKRHTHEINFVNVIWTNDFMLLLLLFNTTRAHALRAPCYSCQQLLNCKKTIRVFELGIPMT